MTAPSGGLTPEALTAEWRPLPAGGFVRVVAGVECGHVHVFKSGTCQADRVAAAAAQRATEPLVAWRGQADALLMRLQRSRAYARSVHGRYEDVDSVWLAEVETLLAALAAPVPAPGKGE